MLASLAAALALGAALAYGAIALVLYRRQRRLMYPADPTPAVAAAIGGRPPQELTGRAADGLVYRHWLWPPADAAAPLVLLFHGNAGHLGDRVEKYAPLVAAGCGLLLAGYRGYGGNPGLPAEAGLLADARAAVTAAQVALPQARLALFGESLGAAVAVALAAEGLGERLVLEAPFDSAVAVARAHYPWLPVGRLLRDRWDSLARIAAVRQPLLWIHGTEDGVTPLALGRRLYEAAPGPKQALVIPGGGHVDNLERPEVMAAVVAFLRAG